MKHSIVYMLEQNEPPPQLSGSTFTIDQYGTVIRTPIEWIWLGGGTYTRAEDYDGNKED